MDIGGTSLFNAYSGGYLAQAQSRSAQDSRPSGPQPAAPVITAAESMPDGRSTPDTKDTAGSSDRKAEKAKPESSDTPSSSKQLSEEEQRNVRELKQRDREVRAHEAAHLAAAGRYATGGASFEYERGPDGRSYAVGGEVGIDTSPVPNDPQATIQKARVIKTAALAPADPSTTDRKVAVDAARMEAEARQEISRQRAEEKAINGAAGNELTALQPHKEHVDSADNRHVAESAYRIVKDFARSEVSDVSHFELTA